MCEQIKGRKKKYLMNCTKKSREQERYENNFVVRGQGAYNFAFGAKKMMMPYYTHICLCASYIFHEFFLVKWKITEKIENVSYCTRAANNAKLRLCL